jgi:uncharacterized membrane protein YeaQ/YmgE (transglycosylase-associated protein family)
VFHLVGQAIFGLVVGVLAKFLLPGKDPGGLIVTALIGLAGSMIGTFIGRTLRGNADYASGWIMSIIGAMILLGAYRLMFAKK